MNMMRNNKRNNNGSNGGMRHRGNGNGHRRHNNGSNHRGTSDPQNLSRQKHHASQMRDKFQTMAQDALRSGERVDAEYYFQHVDHYMRVLADIAVIEAERFAHQREQHAIHADAQNGEGEADGDAPEAHDGNEHPQQPRRQHRSPRPPRNHDQHTATPNVEAVPAHTEPQALPVPREIALPASMLTEIPTAN